MTRVQDGCAAASEAEARSGGTPSGSGEGAAVLPRPAPIRQQFTIPVWSGAQEPQEQPAAQQRGPPPEVPDNPWRKRTGWNWSGCLVYGLFICAYLFYFYVRIRYTLGGGILWYSMFVLVFEVLASSSMVIHGLSLLRLRKETVPPAGVAPPEQNFNIRVVIPCYTESLDIVRLTVLAAANAQLPGKCTRTVYLLDDGKDPAKCEWVAQQNRSDIVYISGRVRQKGESNGKACNLNNTLAKLYPTGKRVDDKELVALFDADMVCVPEFFLRVLVELLDPQVALVLTPQKFHNYDMSCDIFNHSNLIYWQISLPGLDGWDNVCCTGTNFVVRARAAAEAGWFPTYTLGEDMALALEIQKAGWKGAYVKEYLAVGEVPETVRNAFMQKSRWCKGGMQIFLSHHNAIFASNMSIMQKLLWNTSGWAYICTTLTTPVFLVVPIIGVWAGYFPLEFTWWFALAFSVYFPATWMLLYYCHHVSYLRSIYFSIIAGNMFWFAYAKATFNTMISTLLKRQIKFKTTEKSVMAATVTDAANKAKNAGRANSPLTIIWTNVQDVWIHVLTFVVCLATAVVGFVRLMQEVDVHTVQTLSILVSMGWAAYNMTAPYLLLHYCFFRNRGLRITTIITALTSTAIVATIVVLIWIVLPNEYNYSSVLRLSYKFYEAQKSGQLPADNPISWRGNSALGDVAPDGTSLVGGFYDDGGVVKASFPLAFTTTVLAWGMLVFPQGYHAAGLSATGMNTLKWATDYMLKCHLKDGNGALAYVAQVGTYAASKQWWGRPEELNTSRPVFLVDSTHPGADLLSGTAAALAASSMAFQDSSAAYADILYAHAEQLFQVATTHPGLYSDSVPDAAYQYPSSGYLDDLAWAAAWLYAAQRNPAYLTEAESYFALASKEASGPATFNWDNVLPGTAVLMANLTSSAEPYRTAVAGFLDSWMNAKNGVVRTPSYGSWLGPTGSLRNAANAAFLAWVDAKQGHNYGKQTCWAEYNIRLMLGDNIRSFIVGYGPNAPQRPQHGGASCPGSVQDPCNVTALWAPGPNPHVLEGALVSGPMAPDNHFRDVRTLVSSRVALDYNAAFSGVLAALVEQKQATFTHCTQGHGFFYNMARHSPI